MELVWRGFQLLTFKDDNETKQHEFRTQPLQHWDPENGRDGRECQTRAIKMNPFYRLENRGLEQFLVLGHKGNQDREARPEPWAPGSPLALFPQISGVFKSSPFCVQGLKDIRQRLKAEAANKSPQATSGQQTCFFSGGSSLTHRVFCYLFFFFN